MNEVVVVGYGKASKRDLTGSIARIDAKEVQDFPASLSDNTNNPTNPIAYIDPNDIESVEVLKDASAAAIYGARAANGVIRLAGMYLTRGEGNLVAGTNIGNDPLDDINTIRSRSGASNLATVSQTDFIEERFRELGFEGDRLWSERRVKWNISGLSYDDDKLVMPIPQPRSM